MTYSFKNYLPKGGKFNGLGLMGMLIMPAGTSDFTISGGFLGSSPAISLGQSFGILKGICSAMQLSMYFVRPAKWKKYFNLINSQKDASRTKAIEIFPYISTQLSRKKDANKADAILIASFFYETYRLEE